MTVFWKAAALFVRSLLPRVRLGIKLKAPTSIWLRNRPSPLLGRLEMFLNSHLTLISSKISVGGCQRVCAHICKCNSLTPLLRSCFLVTGMRLLTFIQSIVSWNSAKLSTKYAYCQFVLSHGCVTLQQTFGSFLLNIINRWLQPWVRSNSHCQILGLPYSELIRNPWTIVRASSGWASVRRWILL